MSTSRRTFLKTSALAAAGAILPARSWGRVLGANDDLRVAVIGLNGRGQNHLQSLARIQGVRVVALCDPDTAVLDRVKGKVNNGDVKLYTDIRELLNSKDIDAVTIATPNHWHSLAGDLGDAGRQGRVRREAGVATTSGKAAGSSKRRGSTTRSCQAGTQIRSSRGIARGDAVDPAPATSARSPSPRGLCYKRRDSIGKTTGPQPIPATVNYDLWCGPAALVAPHRNNPKNGPSTTIGTGSGSTATATWATRASIRWTSPAGASARTNCRATLHQRRRPLRLHRRRRNAEHAGRHPRLPTAPLIFEVRGLPKKAGIASAGGDPALNQGGGGSGMDNYRGVDIGNVIDCEGGSLITTAYFNATAYDKSGKVVKEFKGTDRHMQNFVDVVRSRKTEELYGPIEEGNTSSALCHLGNISHQIGYTHGPDKIASQIKSDAKLSEAYGRMAEHLRANNVDLTKTPLTLGAPLIVDAKNERFTGANAEHANKLLTAEYRAPFTVPSIA